MDAARSSGAGRGTREVVFLGDLAPISRQEELELVVALTGLQKHAIGRAELHGLRTVQAAQI